jgi:hypothetical protein
MVKSHRDIDWNELERDDIVEFFNEKFSEASFFTCFFYMDGYMDIKKSTKLGQFFCKCKLS